VSFPVEYAAEGLKGQTKAKQISEFGILIGPLDQPQLMSEKHVRLQFTLPGSETLELKGYCAYITTTSAGIRFETMNERNKSLLGRFVNTSAEASEAKP
jgi:hypothetical protein